jgi:hypothetical protein
VLVSLDRIVWDDILLPVGYTQKLKLNEFVKDVKGGGVEIIQSSIPSNTILPPFAPLNVGPFTNVPLFPPREISLHTVLALTYEFGLAASTYNTNPSITVPGPPFTVLIL